MASNRIGRINEEIQRELAELIRSLKDPRVQTMISITRVDTTPDLRYSQNLCERAGRGPVAGRAARAEVRGRLAAARARQPVAAALYAGARLRRSTIRCKYGAHMFDLLEKLERQEAAREAEKANDEG